MIRSLENCDPLNSGRPEVSSRIEGQWRVLEVSQLSPQRFYTHYYEVEQEKEKWPWFIRTLGILAGTMTSAYLYLILLIFGFAVFVDHDILRPILLFNLPKTILVVQNFVLNALEMHSYLQKELEYYGSSTFPICKLSTWESLQLKSEIMVREYFGDSMYFYLSIVGSYIWSWIQDGVIPWFE